MNIGVLVSVELVFLFSADKYPGVKLLDCMAALFLIFEKSPYDVS